MASIADKIARIREKLHPQDMANEDVDKVIQETEISEAIYRDYEDRLRLITSAPTVAPETMDMPLFSGFDIQQEVSDSVKEWNDLQPGRKPFYTFTRYAFDQENDQLDEFLVYCDLTFLSMFTSLSAQTVMALLEIAYNLRSRSGDYVFAEQEDGLKAFLEEKELSQISDIMLHAAYDKNPLSKIAGNATNRQYKEKLATSYCFLAASIIRLATKSASNYSKIGEHLKRGFKQFYSYDCIIENYTVTEATAESIKSCFNNDDTIRHNLYMLLLAGEATSMGMPMKDFLYRIHTQYTGMHTYVLFTRVAQAYEISTRQLATFINSKIFTKALLALADFCQKFPGNKGGSQTYGMWKYARIFEPKFYSELSTKNCLKFAATLAHLLHLEVASDNRRAGNVLQIAQLQNLTDAVKQFAHTYAQRAQYLINSSLLDGNYGVVAEGMMKKARID